MKARYSNLDPRFISILGENPDTTCGSAEIIDSKHGTGLFLGVQLIDGPLKYGKIQFLDGIYIGDFDEDSSDLRLGTFTYKDGRLASGVFEAGELLTGTISFPDGRVFYAKERFDEDGTYDGAMFEADGKWSQGTYDAETMRLIGGWRFDSEGNVVRRLGKKTGGRSE